MTRAEIEAGLAEAIDAESATGFRWWPGNEMAPIAYRRLVSFARRNAAKHPTDEQRAVDLVKGLQAHFEPEIPYTSPGDWLHLARMLVKVFRAFVHPAIKDE
jgi:hypothetical protein